MKSAEYDDATNLDRRLNVELKNKNFDCFKHIILKKYLCKNSHDIKK